jgi:hypothetical protein
MKKFGKVIGWIVICIGFAAYCIDTSDRFGIIRLSKDKKESNFSESYQSVKVSNEVFENQQVILDGYEYSHCAFRNVTFVYNGDAPVKIDSSTFNGNNKLTTSDKAIDNAIYVLLAIKAIEPKTELHFIGAPNAQRPLLQKQK